VHEPAIQVVFGGVAAAAVVEPAEVLRGDPSPADLLVHVAEI